MNRSILAISLLAAATLTACGGGECLPEEKYYSFIKAGHLKPRPPMKPTDHWDPPFLLTLAPAQMSSLGKLQGTAVRSEKFPTHLVTGPYYAAGETPYYVCPKEDKR